MEKVVNQSQLSSYYSGKKVFITGHTGFKGSWLALWLQILGAEVKGYALAPEKKGGLFDLLKFDDSAASIIDDVRNKQRLNDEINGFKPDFIFHLAAQPLVRRSYKIPSETFDVNVVGTANLLEAVSSLHHKCTVVVITTDKVYENKEMDVLYNENDVLGGYDPYSASKACTEIVVSSFRNSFFNLSTYDKHGKAIASARAGNVIGGGDYSDDRIIPDIVKSLRIDSLIEVRNPHAVRPWQHVLEPIGGYLLLGGLLHDEAVRYSGAYNFGPKPDDHLTVKELVELSIESWGHGKWKDISESNQPHEAGLLKLDINKSKNILHWEPRLSAKEAISWTMEWYKQKDGLLEFTTEQIRKYMNR